MKELFPLRDGTPDIVCEECINELLDFFEDAYYAICGAYEIAMQRMFSNQTF